jgi:hypothetical protein
VNVVFATIRSSPEEKHKNKKGQTNMKIGLSGSVGSTADDKAFFRIEVITGAATVFVRHGGASAWTRRGTLLQG